MQSVFRRLSPARFIAIGFAATILIGSALLMLPVCVKPGVSLPYIDALYTSASAVCVTGLLTVDVGDTFTAVGQTIIAVLIQIGGLGVGAIGAGIMLATRRRMDLKSMNIVREAGNLDAGRGVTQFLSVLFKTTLVIELCGAVLSFPTFVRYYPVGKAIGISLFHAIAAFNNSGFDILGGGRNLAPFRDDIPLNLVTCALIIFGGIGFLVIGEIRTKRFAWKRYSMHAKIVLSTSAVLTVGGALLLWLTERFSPLAALFHSVSARTAGFSTVPLGNFSEVGLLVLIVLMFIGASPGSTGGGIKTTTFFTLLVGIRSAATNRSEKAFRYSLPKEAFRKSAVITLIGLLVVLVGTLLFMLAEPTVPLVDALFEVVSAFGTVGLSTGITPTLGLHAKLLSILLMYIGRLGPLTVATLWYFSHGERVRFPEGDLAIG
jgi:hypothetical protein